MVFGRIPCAIKALRWVSRISRIPHGVISPWSDIWPSASVPLLLLSGVAEVAQGSLGVRGFAQRSGQVLRGLV
jgi:hypothetical protein